MDPIQNGQVQGHTSNQSSGLHPNENGHSMQQNRPVEPIRTTMSSVYNPQLGNPYNVGPAPRGYQPYSFLNSAQNPYSTTGGLIHGQYSQSHDQNSHGNLADRSKTATQANLSGHSHFTHQQHAAHPPFATFYPSPVVPTRQTKAESGPREMTTMTGGSHGPISASTTNPEAVFPRQPVPSPQSPMTQDISSISVQASVGIDRQTPILPKELPYNPSSLTWNADRTLNEEHKYCYCADDRNLLDVDVQCSKCSNFFHGRCIQLNMGPVVPFMTNYQFICRNCHPAGTEVFTRNSCSWKNVCATALANLILMRLRITNQTWEKANYAAANFEHLMPDLGWYSRKGDIIPFLEIPRHWAAICTEKEKGETSAWASTLGNSLVSNPDAFRVHDETLRSANSGLTLRNLNLFAFRHGYFSHGKSHAPRKRKAEDSEPTAVVSVTPAVNILKTDNLKGSKSDAVFIPPERVSQRERPVVKIDDVPAFTANIPTIKKEPVRPASIATKEMARERKPTAKRATLIKKVDQSPAKLIRRPPPYRPQDFNARPKPPGMTQVEGQFPQGPYFSFTDIPYNKRGFRYTMCEAAPAMPAIMYRQVEVEPHEARIDWSDMSQYMYLSKDGKSATTDKGFRMGRANVGVREGQWYWEVKVLRGNGDQGGHVRLGIARREASIDGPVGFDGYSYGIRDKGGEKLHLSRPRAFMESFGTGDVIGFHLSLPKAPNTEISRDRIPIRYRQQLYFEQFEYNSSKEMEDLLNPGTQTVKPTVPPVLKGSFLKVYKNGRLMGTVFDNLFSFWPPNSQTQRDQPAKDDGSLGYYPAVSVYHGGAVSLNFGPDFECPPQKDIFKGGVVRSMSQRFDEQVAEDTLYDLMDEIDVGEDLKELSLGQQQLEVEPIREIAEYD